MIRVPVEIIALIGGISIGLTALLTFARIREYVFLNRRSRLGDAGLTFTLTLLFVIGVIRFVGTSESTSRPDWIVAAVVVLMAVVAVSAADALVHSNNYIDRDDDGG